MVNLSILTRVNQLSARYSAEPPSIYFAAASEPIGPFQALRADSLDDKFCHKERRIFLAANRARCLDKLTASVSIGFPYLQQEAA